MYIKKIKRKGENLDDSTLTLDYIKNYAASYGDKYGKESQVN